MLTSRARVLVSMLLLALLAPAVAQGAQSGGLPTGAPAAAAKAPARAAWGDLYPAFPGDIVVRQPDGSSVKAQLTDAEVGGNLELDGFTLTKRADGWWVYAAGRDGTTLTESSARAGHDDPPAGLLAGVGRTRDVWLDANGLDMRAQTLRQLQIASWKASQQAAAEGTERVFRFPVLMLATWWDEQAGQTEPQFQEGNTPEKYKQVLDGFGGNPNGTLTEFYFENSFGQFLVQVDVYGPYTSQRSRQDRCYYGDVNASDDPADDLDPLDNALPGGGGAVGMAVEAVPQADADVDFSQYDNDGDGFVDFTAILHSGPDMAATGDPCHTWSHAISAGLAGSIVEETAGLPHNSVHHGIPTTDGVMVDRLFTMPEVNLEIGVATHEMAHALGEPDYYNPAYTSMGTGDWDIMAGGSWFGNPPGSNPTGFNPASKVFQGWITPKVIEESATDVSLAPRSLQPTADYDVTQVDPNVVLVPTKTIAVGETDEQDHAWTEDDVYGLTKVGDDRYVIEGYYLENWSRSVNAPPFDERMTRQPYFDRQALGSGLMVWHFDYYRRSNVYFGGNDAGSDPNRPQMDPVEFDWNDNTQELQLGLTRGEPQDVIAGAATGITSGTRKISIELPAVDGDPQAEEAWSSVVPPTQTDDHVFTVEDNPANYQMRVSVAGMGDCTLELLHDGNSVGGVHDAGFVADEEFVDIVNPEPGEWTARTGDFAACGAYDGTITFSRPDQVFDTKGAGDTWSNWTEAPTGWAFTNVRPSETDGRDTALDTGDGVITLDVLHLADGATDLSPGFIVPGNIAAGRANALHAPLFNNGDTAVGAATVTVHRDAPDGAVVAEGTINNLAPYSRTDLDFDITPDEEGALELYVTVDEGDAVAEDSEANNSQRSVLQVSPAGARVLVVDDDGAADSEDTVTGALSVLGIPFDVVSEHTDAATMSGYDAVIWEAGLERYQGQMDANDRAAVAEYLDGGGKLLYASPRAAAALGEPPGGTNPLGTPEMAPFLADYFGAAYADTVQVGGGLVTGTDILDGGTFATDVFPGRPLQDVFTEAESSKGAVTPIATWEKGGEGSLMGLRVEGDDGFRTVFLGFNPSQLLAGDDVATVMSRTLTWLGIEPGGYATPSGAVIRHTAVRNVLANADVAVKAFVVGTSETPTLSYRTKGAGAFVTVPMTEGQPGVWQATIPAAVVTSDGVEYFVSAGAASDPFTEGLPHFVAVPLAL